MSASLPMYFTFVELQKQEQVSLIHTRIPFVFFLCHDPIALAFTFNKISRSEGQIFIKQNSCFL